MIPLSELGNRNSNHRPSIRTDPRLEEEGGIVDVVTPRTATSTLSRIFRIASYKDQDASPATTLQISPNTAPPLELETIHQPQVDVKRSVRENLYLTSLIVIFMSTVIAIVVTALDMLIAPQNNAVVSSSKTFVIIGCYALMAVLTMVIAINRVLRVRKAIMNIPKLIIPIQKHSVPLSLYIHVHSTLNRIISMNLDPLEEESLRDGWGRSPAFIPPNEGKRIRNHVVGRRFRGGQVEHGNKNESHIQYRRAVLQSFVIVETAVLSCGGYPRIKSLSVGDYLKALVDTYDLEFEIIQYYASVLRRARLINEFISEADYLDVMKSVVIITRKISTFKQHMN